MAPKPLRPWASPLALSGFWPSSNTARGPNDKVSRAEPMIFAKSDVRVRSGPDLMEGQANVRFTSKSGHANGSDTLSQFSRFGD
jgi:hypothetical protein